MADIETLDTNNVLPPPFKTTDADELQQARKALDKIEDAAHIMKASVEIEFVDASSLAMAQANVQATIDEFMKTVDRAVRSTK